MYYSAGMSFGYDYGGESTIDGADKNDRKKDTAWALNYVYPIDKRSGFKVAYIRTRTLEPVGNDTDTLTAGFSILR